MIAGGSGVVPFRSMLRHWAAGAHNAVPRLIYSSRTLSDVIYQEELTRLAAQDGVDVRFALTREWPDDFHGHRGRVDPGFLEDSAWPPDEQPLVYICGPTSFVEAVAQALVDIGHEPSRVKTERFGPTGT
jgi:ferredoxin-NADP reductase